MGLIYKITNLVNDKVYIGKTIRTLDERKREHLKDYKIEDTKLYRAMRKYGVDNFVFSIVEDDIPNEQTGYCERKYIKEYNSYYEGYNSTFGGEGESSIDEDIIIKLFLEGNNCTTIEKKTNYTRKTISSVLKRNGYEVKNHLGKNSEGVNGTEIKVTYLNENYNSLTELAYYLKENEDTFKDKKIPTIIQGISRSLKNGSSYFGRKFYYSS